MFRSLCLRKFAFEMYGANLSIDLHKRSRISADDTNQKNSELEIRLSAVDDPGDRWQEVQQDLSKGLSYK